jgi:hypothetical protein
MLLLFNWKTAFLVSPQTPLPEKRNRSLRSLFFFFNCSLRSLEKKGVARYARFFTKNFYQGEKLL